MSRRTTLETAARWALAGLILAVLVWFPLFHVVPLKKAAAEKAAGVFNPAQFAERFWGEKLLPALDQTVKAATLVHAIQAGAATAKTNFSRSVGMGESYYYFLSGTGRVASVSDDEVLLVVTTGGTNAEVSLQTGLVFGNALRDGTGLLNVSDFPNSQDFNGIAEALNHLVETNVLPKLRLQAKVGANIFFAGCAEVDDETSDLKPLKVIPIEVTTRPD
jgi:predicted lipoprotein